MKNTNRKSLESIKQGITKAVMTLASLDALKELKREIENGDLERCFMFKFETTCKRDFIQAIDYRLITEGGI